MFRARLFTVRTLVVIIFTLIAEQKLGSAYEDIFQVKEVTEDYLRK